MRLVLGDATRVEVLVGMGLLGSIAGRVTASLHEFGMGDADGCGTEEDR